MSLSPKKRKLGGLKLLRSMLLPPEQKKNQRSTPAGRFEPMTAAAAGGLDLLETEAFLYTVASTISLSCTIISCNAQRMQ